MSAYRAGKQSDLRIAAVGSASAQDAIGRNEQIRHRETERAGESLDVLQRHVAFAALDAADIRSMQSCPLGQPLLG